MVYNKENVINCDPNSYSMHHNGKPTVGKIAKCPDDDPTTNCAQTMEEVLGGYIECPEIIPGILVM